MSTHHGAVVWITGLSASGKTTLSRLLAEELKNTYNFNQVLLLDGEELRSCLKRRYGYSAEERFAVVREIVSYVRPHLEQGRIVVVATISHLREMRLYARERLQPFMEVFLDCPMEVCAARDYKGQYLPALKGETEMFVGVTEPYESGARVELTLNTAGLTVAAAGARLTSEAIRFFSEHEVLSAVV